MVPGLLNFALARHPGDCPVQWRRTNDSPPASRDDGGCKGAKYPRRLIDRNGLRIACEDGFLAELAKLRRATYFQVADLLNTKLKALAAASGRCISSTHSGPPGLRRAS
jgi:hypothetical protein